MSPVLRGAGTSRLYDLHLRFHGPSQGGDETPHVAIVNRLLWMQDAYRLDAVATSAAKDAVQL